MSTEHVTVVGVDGAPLSPAAEQAIAEATLVFGSDHDAWVLQALHDGEGRHGGSGRHGGNGADATGVARRPIGDIGEMGAELRVHDGPAVVLAAHDPGFFGLVRDLRAVGVTPRVIPAPSLVQRLCSAIGRPWDDVTVVRPGMPGRGGTLREIVNVCRARPAVAVLATPDVGPSEIAAELHGWERSLVVAEDLGGPRERVTTVDADRAASGLWQDVDVVLCLRDRETVPPASWHAGGPLIPRADGWGLPSTAFSHREGTLAAPEIRSVLLAKLAPRPGVLVWDVGAGSGTIGVECGRLGAAVLAIEQDPGLSVRIVANAASHGVEVCVVEDSAPGVFGMLPDPDTIFVGGGGPAVVAACADTAARRVVVALRGIDHVATCRDALRDGGFAVDGVQLTVTRFATADGARPDGATAVYVLTGTR